MLTNEYVTYAFKNKLPQKQKWYFSTMTINPGDNEYCKIEGKIFLVNINGTWVQVEDSDSTKPLLDIYTNVALDKETIPNIQTDKIDTFFGRALANYILCVVPFGTKIPYLDEKFDVGTVEEIIAKKMVSEEITVPEYLLFVDCVSLLQGIASIVTMSATPKNLIGPPGLKEFKKKVKDHMVKKYGPNWMKDQVKIVEYKKYLSDYDEEWLKDHPTNNKIITGSKVKANGRSKMYLAFGAELGWDTKGEKPILVDNSLTDGYKLDKTELTSVFNSARSGSYNRGKETQKGGAMTKDMLRASSSIEIMPTDCGSTNFKEITVTKVNANALNGRYMKVGNGIKPIEDASKLIGQTIEIRSPIYCKLGGKDLCAVCCGEALRDYRTGASLVVNSMGSQILQASLKKVHSAALSTVDFHFSDVIKG